MTSGRHESKLFWHSHYLVTNLPGPPPKKRESGQNLILPISNWNAYATHTDSEVKIVIEIDLQGNFSMLLSGSNRLNFIILIMLIRSQFCSNHDLCHKANYRMQPWLVLGDQHDIGILEVSSLKVSNTTDIHFTIK